MRCIRYSLLFIIVFIACLYPEVDTEPPEITILFPEPNSIVKNVRPVIAATIFDSVSEVDPRSVRIYLDGIDVTIPAKNSGEMISFTPSYNLSEGVHKVVIVAADDKGNVAPAKTWEFTVKSVEQPIFQLNGSVNSEIWYADVIKYPYYTSYLPYSTGWKGWTSQFTASASGSAFGKFVNLYTYAISQNPTDQQTLQRFRGQIELGWLALAMGDLYPNYSEYTFYGSQRLRGVEVQSKIRDRSPNKFNIIGFAGQTYEPVEGGTFSGTFNQVVYGGRILWDIIEEIKFNVSYFKGKDYEDSIANPVDSTPKSNEVVNIGGSIELPFISTKLDGEFSFSKYNSNTTLAGSQDDNGRAWKVQLTGNFGNHTVNLAYHQVTPSFYSMGNSFLTNDEYGIDLSNYSRFFNNLLFVSFSGYLYWDNIDHQKDTTTVSTSANFNTSLFPRGLPSLNLGFGFQGRKSSESEPTTKNYTMSYIAGLNSSIQIVKNFTITSYLSYLMLQYRDFGVIRGNNFNSLSLTVGWVISMFNLDLTNGFGINENLDLETGILTKYIISSNKIGYNFFDKFFAPYIGYNVLAVLNNSDTMNTRKDSIIAGFTLNFTTTHSLNVNFEHIEYKDNRTSSNSYVENITIVKYSLLF